MSPYFAADLMLSLRAEYPPAEGVRKKPQPTILCFLPPVKVRPGYQGAALDVQVVALREAKS